MIIGIETILERNEKLLEKNQSTGVIVSEENESIKI